ncbi:MAG: hypothetical protein SCAL_000567 [Candidatus Syntrophoarchaeum caldarius]|uniref:Uncharacterized protein n=1 Tax=Candidatus Syntropharchaeum caldarium TaxID=1838285 RepID=A0A1F2P9A4_9EURY|nr:MAG: hypothetical protein SCAL_000567 [Candidatus Syntrophoarchaeum caldarius]
MARRLYGVKSGREVNQTPLINARKSLQEVGFLEKVDELTLRNAYFKSTPLPYLSFLERKLEIKKSSQKLDEEKKKAISLIFDSIWFRTMFQVKRERELPDRFEYFTMRNPIGKRKSKGRLLIKNPLGFVASVFGEVAALSIIFLVYFKKQGYAVPGVSTSDLLWAGNFDAFMREHEVKVIPPVNMRDLYQKLHNTIGLLHLEDAGMAPLFIPTEIANICVRGPERPFLTLLQHGVEILERYNTE